MTILDDLKLPALPEPLPRPVLDSHTHLDATHDHSGLPPADALDLAVSVGVKGVVQIGCDAEDSAWAVQMAQDPRVIACVAIHPNEAARRPDDLGAMIRRIEALCQEDGVRGIGETGLDHYRTTDIEAQRTQRRSFEAHIGLAIDHGLTLVIHDRDAHDDVLATLDAVGWPDRVVFHCFSGDAAFAERCLAHGAWLSFPGTITYRANGHLREAMAITPADKLLVETDAPYLTPVPARGKANASYLIPHTVRFMADELDRDLEELCDDLWNNAEAAFGGAWCER